MNDLKTNFTQTFEDLNIINKITTARKVEHIQVPVLKIILDTVVIEQLYKKIAINHHYF